MLFSRPRSWWLRWLRDILIAVAVFWAAQWWMARGLFEGRPPPLAGFDLDGRQLSLADYRGAPVLVHFWATWCSICRLEQGSIDSLAEDYPVLTVAMTSGNTETLRDYLRKNDLDFPVIVDETGELAQRWKVKGVPVSYVIDGRGQVTWAGAGYSSEFGLRARLWFAD